MKIRSCNYIKLFIFILKLMHEKIIDPLRLVVQKMSLNSLLTLNASLICYFIENFILFLRVLR